MFFDTDTGEVVAWIQRPDRRHVVLDVVPLLAAEDMDDHLASERLAGPRADRVRAFVRSLREHRIPAQIVTVPRSELPRLFQHLPSRRGVSLTDIDPVAQEWPGPSAGFFAWGRQPRSLVSAAHGIWGSDIPDPDLWRALLVAEGRDPSLPPDESAESTDLPDDGRPAIWAVRNAQAFLRGVVGYPNGRLAPETRTLAAVARILRVFPTIDRPEWPLLRRWVWRTALADHDLDLSTEALSVIRDDPVDSAVRLLERAPLPSLVPPGRDVLDPDSRRGRLVLLGIASLHPRDLTSGVLVDIDRDKPKPILADGSAEPANLLFHDHVYHAGLRTVRRAIEHSTDGDRLASHGIDAAAVELLRGGDDDRFLARRAAVLDRAVLDFWTTMIEPAARTRRPVALLFGADDGP